MKDEQITLKLQNVIELSYRSKQKKRDKCSWIWRLKIFNMNISTLLKLIYIVNIILTKEININDNSQTIHKKLILNGL